MTEIDTSVPIRPAVAEVTAHSGRRTRRRPGALVLRVCLCIVAALIVAAVAVPGLLTHTDPLAPLTAPFTAPNGSAWFGTDQLGRDIFARTVYGARPVILASLIGLAISTVIGVTLGIIGGIAPRVVSATIMRVIDIILALPALLIALMTVAVIGSGPTSVVVAVGVAYCPAFARVVYSSARKLRVSDYIVAARAFGASTTYNVFHHLLPNLIGEIVILISSVFGWAILTAATLSFLGFGVSLPTPDWGVDLAAGGTYIGKAWWISTFPGLAITLIILGSNYLGDSIADRLNLGSRPASGLKSRIVH